jgi:hypothetical protein
MGESIFQALERHMNDPATIESFKKLDKAVQFAAVNDQRWREEYPNRWIAVHCDELVAVADTQPELMATVQRLGLPRNEIHTDFLREPRPVTILW